MAVWSGEAVGSHPPASEAEDRPVPPRLPTFKKNLPPRPQRGVPFSKFARSHFSSAHYIALVN